MDQLVYCRLYSMTEPNVAKDINKTVHENQSSSRQKSTDQLSHDILEILSHSFVATFAFDYVLI